MRTTPIPSRTRTVGGSLHGWLAAVPHALVAVTLALFGAHTLDADPGALRAAFTANVAAVLSAVAVSMLAVTESQREPRTPTASSLRVVHEGLSILSLFLLVVNLVAHAGHVNAALFDLRPPVGAFDTTLALSLLSVVVTLSAISAFVGVRLARGRVADPDVSSAQSLRAALARRV